MRRAGLPALLLALLYAAFFAAVAWGAGSLPAWLPGAPPVSRADFLQRQAAHALALPLGTVLLAWASRFLPDGLHTVPRPHYWLAPERRAAFFALLLRRSLWFACMACAFLTLQLVLALLVQRGLDGRTGLAAGLLLRAVFIGATAAWLYTLLRRLRRGTA